MPRSERDDWCMSSIPSSISCPSNVDKSTRPWPRLASRSLISNTSNDNIPLNTDIISSSTLLFSSPFDQSEDYYTNKRIEQLHERMDDIQISSFLKFINHHLASKTEQKFVKDLAGDLANGHILLDLIEIFSSTKLKREHGQTRFHSLTNVQYVLDYLKLHMQHINISPQDIVSGNRKQILALLWIIMKVFDFPSFRITTNKHLFHEHTLFAFGQDRSRLLKWMNSLLNQIFKTHSIYVKDFHLSTWMNNQYLALMIKYLSPLSWKYGTLEYFEHLKGFDRLNMTDQERLELCLKFSNYCFNTLSTIDENDRTEKSCFRFLSEFQQNVLFIIKSNQIGKLTKINPYTKQLSETVTMIEQSAMTNEGEEDYLICTEDEQVMMMMKEESLSTSLSDVASIVQEQQSCSQNSTENDDSFPHLRSHKLNRLSLSPMPHNDLFVQLLDFVRDPKMLTLKYLLLLLCLCFSIILIFIHQ